MDSPLTPERTLKYAGFWIRFAALFIDGIILVVPFFLITFLVADVGVDSDMFAVFYLAMVLVINPAYFALMESSEKQATLGKLAVGIKVGKREGEQMSAANAFGRAYAKFLSQMIFYIGYFMAGFDEKKQALHDKLANTYVYYA